MNIKRSLFLVYLLTFLLILQSCLNQSQDQSERWREFTALDEVIQQELWLEDIAEYERIIVKNHVSPFDQVSEQEFLGQLALFRSELPNLDNNQRFYRMVELSGLIKDGCTVVQPGLEPRDFPFELERFAQGIFVVSAAQEYSFLLGRQLVKVGTQDVDDLFPLLDPYLTWLNSVDRENRQVEALGDGYMLHASGVIENPEQGVFTFKDSLGQLETLLLPGADWSDQIWMDLKGMDQTSWEQQSEDAHFYSLGGGQLGFFHLQNWNEVSINETLLEMAQWEGGDSPRFLVLDLRNPEFGPVKDLKPLLDYLEESLLNRRGRIFIAIGRYTKLEGMEAALALKDSSHAILIGESTSGRPNHLGNRESRVLEHSAMEIIYPSQSFHLMDREVETLEPQIPLEYCFDDYRRGLDPLAELILEQISNIQ